MRVLLFALGPAAAVLAVLAASPAVLRLRYALRGGRQVLRIELVLLFGLWHRRWRVPEHGTSPLLSRFGGRLQRQTVPGPRPGRPPAPGRPSPVWRGVGHLRGRVRLRRVHLRALVGTGDPALSAVAVGSLHAALGAGGAFLAAYFRLPAGFRPDVALLPDYRRTQLQAELDCIAETALGHLTLAVLLAFGQNWRTRPAGAGAAQRPPRAAGG